MSRFVPITILIALHTSLGHADIFQAAKNGDIAEIRSYLGSSASLSVRNASGYTPLHCAVIGNQLDAVQLLLSGGADARSATTGGVTPLHIAASLGWTEIVRALLAADADPSATDKQRRTPLSLAVAKDHRQVETLLRAAAAGSIGSQTERRQHPRVLIDRSHCWAFAWDDLSERMLRPFGCDVVMSDASLDTKARLRDFDVVMVPQWMTAAVAAEFSRDEIDLLKQYVVGGGALLMVARPGSPSAFLAEAFGCPVTQQQVPMPLSADTTLQSHGSPPSLKYKWAASGLCAVSPPQSAQVLLRGADGTPVAACFQVGKGTALVMADDGSYFDFCGQREGPDWRVATSQTTIALFRSLLPVGVKPGGPGAPVERLTGELAAEQPGFVVRYSRPLQSVCAPILTALPAILRTVLRSTQTVMPTQTFEVNLLACDGGGWAGGRAIGIQAFGQPAANIAVIAHELTHCMTGPLPGLIGEGWSSLVGMRATAAAGYRDAADREREQWNSGYCAAEQGGVRLDLGQQTVLDAQFASCEGKMMYMIEQLEQQHGANVMPRFLQITRALKGANNPSVQEVLAFLGLSAGTDLGPWYASLGVSYAPPVLPATSEVEARVKEYKQHIQYELN